jgi:hypothetical protein
MWRKYMFDKKKVIVSIARFLEDPIHLLIMFLVGLLLGLLIQFATS